MSPTRKRAIIWVVDDEPSDHELLSISLEPLEHRPEVSGFYSSEEALEALDTGEEPSLVLLDLNMPGRGGFHFLDERSRRALMHLPVVVLTSSSSPDDVERAYKLGANSYLRKPSTFQEYESFAEILASYWFDWAHIPEAPV